MVSRMSRSSRFDGNTFLSLKEDPKATGQALIVLVLAGICFAVGHGVAIGEDALGVLFWAFLGGDRQYRSWLCLVILGVCSWNKALRRKVGLLVPSTALVFLKFAWADFPLDRHPSISGYRDCARNRHNMDSDLDSSRGEDRSRGGLHAEPSCLHHSHLRPCRPPWSRFHSLDPSK